SDTALDHVFVTVMRPFIDPTGHSVARRDARAITANNMIGAVIPRDTYDEVVLFPSNDEGTAPEGEITFAFESNRESRLRLFGLTPDARYTAAVTLSSVTLTPAGPGE